MCFIVDYVPKATCDPQELGVDFKDLAGKGVDKENRLDWIEEGFKRFIEEDLFDVSQIPEILERCTTSPTGQKDPQIEVDSQRLIFLTGIGTAP